MAISTSTIRLPSTPPTINAGLVLFSSFFGSRFGGRGDFCGLGNDCEDIDGFAEDIGRGVTDGGLGGDGVGSS
jgi:hypothetical protein